MAPKTSRASKGKGKKSDSAIAKRAYKPMKSAAKTAATAAKRSGVQKLSIPKLMNKRQVKAALAEHELEYKINKDNDELPNHRDADSYEMTFVQGSEANMTWGAVNNGGTQAPIKARRGRGLADIKKRLQGGVRQAMKKSRTMPDGMAAGIMVGEDGDSEDETDAEAETARVAREDEELVEKSGGRSRFLELPKEIREMIYGFLLVKDKPIVLHCNWSAVQRVGGVTFDHNILKVNKLIASEGTKYFYQHSTFHALVRAAMANWRHLDRITERFLGYFRDVILEVADKNIHSNPEERLMHQSLLAPKTADCQLNSLTIVLSPYRIQIPMAQNPLLGVAPNAFSVAYADWFKKGSDIHRALTKGIRCRELFVVVKLTAGGREGRVVLRIDTVHLPQNFRREQIIDSWEVVKERLISWAEMAKREVELIAHDLEWLTAATTAELSWDAIRIKVMEYEVERVKEYGDEAGGRMRVMAEDEEIEGLKWWTREQRAKQKAAEGKRLMEVAEVVEKRSIGQVKEMEVDQIEAVQSTPTKGNNEAVQDQPMEDAQAQATQVDNAPVIPSASVAPFVPAPGESVIHAAFRARRGRLRALADAGDLPSAPAPEPVPVEPGTLQALLGNLTTDAPTIAPLPEVSDVAAPAPLQTGGGGEEATYDVLQEELEAAFGEGPAANREALFFPYIVTLSEAGKE